MQNKGANGDGEGPGGLSRDDGKETRNETAPYSQRDDDLVLTQLHMDSETEPSLLKERIPLCRGKGEEPGGDILHPRNAVPPTKCLSLLRNCCISPRDRAEP